MKTYVGTDGKLHFIDSAGADTALPFSKATGSKSLIYGYNGGEGTYFWIPEGCTEAYVLLHTTSGHTTASISRIYGASVVSYNSLIQTNIVPIENQCNTNVWFVAVKCNGTAGNLFVELNAGNGASIGVKSKVTIIYPTQKWD